MLTSIYLVRSHGFSLHHIHEDHFEELSEPVLKKSSRYSQCRLSTSFRERSKDREWLVQSNFYIWPARTRWGRHPANTVSIPGLQIPSARISTHMKKKHILGRLRSLSSAKLATRPLLGCIATQRLVSSWKRWSTMLGRLTKSMETKLLTCAWKISWKILCGPNKSHSGCQRLMCKVYG